MITMASKMLSTDQQNFVRLGIGCVDLIKLVLKDILKIQIQPKDLYNAITSCPELTTGRHRLRPEQQRISFLSPPLVPDYDKFDVSLLYSLIRNLCTNLKPTQGWGKTPTINDIQIGDDIERIRLFRNEMFAHLKSTAVPDTEFIPQWKDLEIIIQRIQAFVTSKSYSANYEKDLANIKKSDFGFDDMQKYKILLEGMMHLLKQREDEDIPRISINGEDKVLCGEMVCFEAKVEHSSKSTNWSITWQKVRINGTDYIYASAEKYKGSTNTRLVIHRVSKEDEGEYQAVIKWVLYGQIHYITSNTISLNALGERPDLRKLNVRTGTTEITILYEYEDSPKVHHIRWTKNGETLNIDQERYVGGGLSDSYLTITSPTSEDRGEYTCIVTNAVGDVSESLVLDFPNATICTENSVCFGNETRISANITSCPGCEGLVWQKSSDSTIFTDIDVGEPKYYGSKLDPKNPVLIITSATFHDKLFYRLVVWNKIGECSSNTVSINVTGDAPNISNSHETNIQDRSVTLISEVFLYENSPSLKEIVWMKNDEVIDIAGSKGKYTGGKIRDASLVINDVNKYDSGSYQCKASNAVGSTTGCRIVLGVPEIYVESPEKSKNGTLVFRAILKSTPAVIQVQWGKKNEEDDKFVPIDITSEEYVGTSNSIPNPVLEIKKTIDIKTRSFQIQAWNFIGTSAKRIPDQMQRIEMDSWEIADNDTLLAAIEIGSTYSTYAFGLNFNIEEKMSCPIWGEERGIRSNEAPTTVLLDENKQFVAFGYEAEDRYADLAEEEEHKEYFYFPRFKMMLSDKIRKERLTMNTTVPDILNKEIPAIEIFTHVIRYFKEHLLNHLTRIRSIFTETYIFWVVTVPAIWDDPGKEFMRKAAEKAGIKKDKLIIALESEAAFTWCKHLLVEKLQGSGDKADSFQVGSKYVVLDAGDETVDLTIHEVEGGGTLRKLTSISGRGCGGVSVDNAFKAALTDIVGEDLMDEFRRKYEDEYIELFRDFQMKRIFDKSEGVFVSMKIPLSFLDVCGNMTRKISSSKYNGNIKVEVDKLKINHSTFEDFFKPACVKIVDLVRQLLKSPDARGVELILMVGGFSESQVLQNAIKRALCSNYQVFIPKLAPLAVIQGAVLFGKNPNTR